MLVCEGIRDKQIWDSFIISQPHHTFLHSWAWGEFNDVMGDKVSRFGVYENKELVAASSVTKVHAKRGNFLFIPHGPLIRQDCEEQAILEILINELKKLGEQKDISFIRISPILEDTQENRNLFTQFGFRPAPIHMHAETTWTLDLTPSEEELLAGMRKTTRNLIRRAVKEGVEIREGTSEKDVEIFNTLYQETVAKHHFTPFSLPYIKSQIKIFGVDNHGKIFTAWHNNEPLASAVVIFYGNSAFYHHGASRVSKIPAAYLLQWEAMREAKRRGHAFYNFWGIVKEDAPRKHPWQGITLFKKGFGGFQTDYMHAQDLPLSWKYWPNYLLETIRRVKRGL